MIHTFQVRTSKQTEFIDVSGLVRDTVKKAGVDHGICIIFVPHTTAAVTINENADPSVVQDMIMGLDQMVPFQGAYRHREGNSPAHIKASLVGCSEIILVQSGKLVLGTWQGIFFCEFDGPRSRQVHVKVISGGQ